MMKRPKDEINRLRKHVLGLREALWAATVTSMFAEAIPHLQKAIDEGDAAIAVMLKRWEGE